METDAFELKLEESRALFLEQLEIMRKAWTEDDFTHQGQFFTVPRPITMLPKPLQKPHPQIWIACQSEQTIDWTADQGYFPIFSGSSGGTQIFGWRERFMERWRSAGHANPNPQIAVQRFVYVCDDEPEARAALRWPRWQRRLASHLRNASERIVAELWDRVVYGPPERCIAQLRRDAEMGFSDFIGWFDVGGLPAETVQRSMRRFAAEVMPAVSEANSGVARVGGGPTAASTASATASVAATPITVTSANGFSGAPVASVNRVSPSNWVCTGRIARARPSCAVRATRPHPALSSRAVVTIQPM
jgi:alkanesulfonate monooxygenase SsuD/methylene tetrahydromethanopterin reductase-like flavin-dependent oxidoreductase (luciferase family)